LYGEQSLVTIFVLEADQHPFFGNESRLFGMMKAVGYPDLLPLALSVDCLLRAKNNGSER
jgi:hypothetical protein